jgi:hypothetical protein
MGTLYCWSIIIYRANRGAIEATKGINDPHGPATFRIRIRRRWQVENEPDPNTADQRTPGRNTLPMSRNQNLDSRADAVRFTGDTVNTEAGAFGWFKLGGPICARFAFGPLFGGWVGKGHNTENHGFTRCQI